MSFEAIDQQFAKIATSLGKPEDQMRMLIITFLAFPIGYMFRFLNGKWPRHGYSIVVGVILHVFMFRWESLHFWALDIVVYLILTLFKNRRKQAWVVLIV
jgi:hypothetical protein